VRHTRQKLHRKFSPDSVLAIRAFLLLELDRVQHLATEYARRAVAMKANGDDVMITFVDQALAGFLKARQYLNNILHNLPGMNWLDAEMKAAFAAADQYVPPPTRKPLEAPATITSGITTAVTRESAPAAVSSRVTSRPYTAGRASTTSRGTRNPGRPPPGAPVNSPRWPS
jgi:hypothetical protein